MKDKTIWKLKNSGNKLVDFSSFLNRNTGFLILVAVIVFGFISVGFAKDNKVLLQNTSTTIDQLEKVLCEDIPDKECNLSQAVNELKLDNERQTRYISCLLAVSGNSDVVEGNVEEQCKKMSSNINIEDVTRVPSSSQSAQNTPQPAQNQPQSNNATTQNNPQTPQPTPLLCRPVVNIAGGLISEDC